MENILRIILATQILIGLAFSGITICYKKKHGEAIDKGVIIDEIVLGSFARASGATFSITTLWLIMPSIIQFILTGEPNLGTIEYYIRTAAALGALIILVYAAYPYWEKIRVKKQVKQ